MDSYQHWIYHITNPYEEARVNRTCVHVEYGVELVVLSNLSVARLVSTGCLLLSLTLLYNLSQVSTRGDACALTDIRFSVESMDSNQSAASNKFAIDGRNGFAKLCLISSLDYETHRTYDLRIAAISAHGKQFTTY
jgi:hypothetical protein